RRLHPTPLPLAWHGLCGGPPTSDYGTDAAKSGKARRTPFRFTPKDDITLFKEVMNHAPFASPYGQTPIAWDNRRERVWRPCAPWAPEEELEEREHLLVDLSSLSGRSSPSSDDHDVDKLDGANGHNLDIRDPTTAAPVVAAADSLKKRELDLLAALLAVEEKRLALETARLELGCRNHDATAKILQENSAEILLAFVGGNLARSWQENANKASLYEASMEMDGNAISDGGSIRFSTGSRRTSSSGSLSGSDFEGNLLTQLDEAK
ncbi:hypothetical protein HK405_015756, partial [Cladochytrium tenue]